MLRSLITLLVVGVTVPVALGEEKDAQAILDKAIQAHGSKKWGDVKVHVWKAKGTMTAGGMKVDYTADYYFQMPNKFRFDLSMSAGGMEIELSAASNGKTAWEKMGPMLRDMEEKKQEEFHHNVYSMNLSFLLPLKNKAYKLTPLGESEVNGKKVVGIRAQRKGQRDVCLYFDRKTGLLAKTKTKVHDEFVNKEVTQESLFTDYVDKNGFKAFGKLTIKRDGKVFIVEELSNQKGLKKARPKLFAKPKGE